jgi:hypothetical protein
MGGVAVIFLLVGVALAQEIVAVPPGKCVRPDVQSYLLPETHYDNCLKAAKNVPVLEDALDECTERSKAVLEPVIEVLDVADQQFDTDQELSAFLVKTVADLDKDLSKSAKRENRLRNQRNVLLAVGGTLLVTTAVGIAL